jgi:GntR family transcriptional regulator, uxu operon transcriptional repressor
MTKAHELANQLADLIGKRTYRIGQRLPSERELSEQFSIARNTVRRALTMLEAEQRLVRNMGRGAYVVESVGVAAPLSAVLAMPAIEPGPSDIMEIRLINEPAAAAIAAVRATQSDLDGLERAADLTVESDTLAERESADASFHLALFRATRNPMLIALAESINEVRRREEWVEGKRRILSAERVADFDRDHHDVVAALRERDPEAARAAMRRHIESLRKNLLGDLLI